MPLIAVHQMNSGIDPARNAAAIVSALRDAKVGGAVMLFTPEMCGLLDRNRKRSADKIVIEAENTVLKQVRAACAKNSIWCALGSLPVDHGSGKYANRSFVIDDDGHVVARYDKIHMFDVDLNTGESWRESKAYRAGNDVVTVDTPVGKLGLTICYDIRFPGLFEELGRQHCDIIAIPAAFTVPTGRDHWHVLQRARAIEASAYVVAAAQSGSHEDGRETFGHSLIVDPWGKVLNDMGEGVGLAFVDIDPNRVMEVRNQLPSLANRRDIPKPQPL